MEPISLIVAALAAGAARAGEETAAQAVTEAYQGLKGLLRRLFGGKPEHEAALDEYEQHPETAEKPLRDALSEVEADKDAEVVEAAQRVMAAADPDGAAAGKFTVNIAGDARGVVAGDHATVTMTFGDDNA